MNISALSDCAQAPDMESKVLSVLRFCIALNSVWESRQSVDWSDAEALHRKLCELSDAGVEIDSAEIKEIIAYGTSEKNWDSGYVSAWPNIVLHAFAPGEKHYCYREGDNDTWEVYAIFVDDGDEDWVATVDTETVAINSCLALYTSWPNAVGRYRKFTEKESNQRWKLKLLLRRLVRSVVSSLQLSRP